MNKAETAREYRQKYGAYMPTLKLARIMYAENDLLFKHVEDARSSLRFIEGKNGNTKESALKKTDADTIVTTDRPRNPYNLPASDETSFLPFNISGHFMQVANFQLVMFYFIPKIFFNLSTISSFSSTETICKRCFIWFIASYLFAANTFVCIFRSFRMYLTM